MSNPTITITIETSRLRQSIDRLVVRMKKRTEDAAERSTRQIVNNIRSHWSGRYPPASKPGHPPAVRTSTLDRSIQLKRQNGGFYTIYEVQAGAHYSKYLEFGTRKMMPRPFLSPALERAKRNLHKNFKGIMHS